VAARSGRKRDPAWGEGFHDDRTFVRSFVRVLLTAGGECFADDEELAAGAE
jgi:hypothetical protein